MKKKYLAASEPNSHEVTVVESQKNESENFGGYVFFAIAVIALLFIVITVANNKKETNNTSSTISSPQAQSYQPAFEPSTKSYEKPIIIGFDQQTKSEKPKVKKQLFTCLNCQDYNILFKNLKWGESFDETGSFLQLQEFSLVNNTDSALSNVSVKYQIIDADGAPVDSGEDTFLTYETVEAGMAKKISPYMSSIRKQDGQKLIFEVLPYNSKKRMY